MTIRTRYDLRNELDAKFPYLACDQMLETITDALWWHFEPGDTIDDAIEACDSEIRRYLLS